MNTTEGTNTNPTAVALAQIVANARWMTQPGSGTFEKMQPHYEAVLDAVVILARINGNTFTDIVDMANEITEEARLNRAATRTRN